jgi:ceramide glucosyltransferase
MTPLPLAAFLLPCAFLTLLAISIILSHVILARRRSPDAAAPLPPLSVVTPLCGVTSALRENVRALLAVDYPAPLDIVFVAATLDDPAWEIVSASLPHAENINVRCIAAGEKPGWLPKTWNLATGLRHARYDVIVFADSDVRLSDSILEPLAVATLDENVGAAYAHPVAIEARNIGGWLDAAVLNYTAFIIQPALAAWGCDALAGSLYAARRQSIEAAGGFESIRNSIADDIALGRRMRKAGLSLWFLSQPVLTANGHRSFGDFVRHQIRWLVTWRCTAGTTAFLSQIFSAVALALPAAVIAPHGILLLAACAAMEMALLAYMTAFMLRIKIHPLLVLLAPPALLFEQVIALYSLATRTVSWGEKKYVLNNNGIIQ